VITASSKSPQQWQSPIGARREAEMLVKIFGGADAMEEEYCILGK